MNQPRYSIVVACYNQRHFVHAAVESAISQTHPSKEVIVVDDGSSDGTPEVLDAFGDFIRLVKFEKNQGAPAARNYGSSLATGEYLVFLDGDDVLMPWALQVYDHLTRALSPKIILGRRFYFRGEVPKATAEEFPDKIDYVDYSNWFQKDREVAFGASSFVVNRSTFSDVGGWSVGIFHLDMTDLLLKLGLAGRTLVIAGTPTVWYREHSANVTRSVAGMIRCAQVLLRKERAGEYPGDLKYWFARSTLLGGPMLSWLWRAVRAGLYVDALKLAGPAWLTILAAIVRRAIAVFTGRRPVQSIDLVND